jgi:hypothetical protein|tara:strand:- start:1525 stop:3681 length:2157 start_codon:yes stop_codon:yes gene_type:complete
MNRILPEFLADQFRWPCRVKTTADVADLAAGAPDPVDGVSLNAGDRVLVGSQSTGSENGIYQVTTVGTGANGVWTRAADLDKNAQLRSGLTVFVEEGTANGGKTCQVTTANTTGTAPSRYLDLDTDAVTIAELSAAAAAHAADHITSGSDEIDGDKLDIDWSPTNYTPSTSPAEADSLDNLTAHLYGIDQALQAGGHNHSATDINAGTLTHERGGLEADVNAFDGLIRISGGATTEIKSVFAGAAAPTVTDDSAAGYTPGSRWVDTTNDKEYVCLDATPSAAVWTETTGAGGGGGMNDLIDDTTPQLGGMLDVNAFAIGDGTRELIKFTEDGTAVNETTIANAATGFDPQISASGDDADVSLALSGQAGGVVRTLSDFQVGSATGPLLQDNSGDLMLRDDTDTADANVSAGNLDLSGYIDINTLRLKDSTGELHVRDDSDTMFMPLVASNLNIGGATTLKQIHLEQGGAVEDGTDGILMGMARSGHSSSNSQILFFQHGWSAGGTTINTYDTWGIRAEGSDNSGADLCIGYMASSTQDADYDNFTEYLRLHRDGNLMLGTTAAPSSSAGRVFVMGDEVATPTLTGSTAALYAYTATDVEVFTQDSAANETQISPHSKELADMHRRNMRLLDLAPVAIPWGYNSSNSIAGIRHQADIAGALRIVEELARKTLGKEIALITTERIPEEDRQSWDIRNLLGILAGQIDQPQEMPHYLAKVA